VQPSATAVHSHHPVYTCESRTAFAVFFLKFSFMKDDETQCGDFITISIDDMPERVFGDKDFKRPELALFAGIYGKP
jgi:hypothetical protein